VIQWRGAPPALTANVERLYISLATDAGQIL